jgi:hypothetical protein
MRRAVVLLALAVACQQGSTRQVDPGDAGVGPDTDGGDPAACTPEPFTGGPLSLAATAGIDCDADPSACPSPCAAGPLQPEWSAAVLPATSASVHQIDFGTSLVDAAGNVFFSTCAGSSSSTLSNCQFSSLTPDGASHSDLDLSNALSQGKLSLRGSLLAGDWAIVGLAGADLGGSVAVLAQSTSDPTLTWTLTVTNSSFVALHHDPVHNRLLLVVNLIAQLPRRGLVLGLEMEHGLPTYRRELPLEAVASLLDGQGNQYLALASDDWSSGGPFGYVQLVASDPSGCTRWQQQVAYRGTASSLLGAVSGGLLFAFGGQALRAEDGQLAYELPFAPASLVLGAADGFAVAGPLMPLFKDSQLQPDQVRLLGFQRATGTAEFATDLAVGAIKTPPVLTSRNTLLVTTVEGADLGTTVLREVSPRGRTLWSCPLPKDPLGGGYVNGLTFSAGRVLTADMVMVPTGTANPPKVPATFVRAFNLGQALAPGSQGWVMQGGSPQRGGAPQR